MTHHDHRDEAATAEKAHRYECPECGCTFEKEPDEPAVCRCPGCGDEVETARTGCECCP